MAQRPAELVQAAHNHIATANPGFADWENLNFTLEADAPVFEHLPGFQHYDFEQIGLHGPSGPFTPEKETMKQDVINGENPDGPIEDAVTIQI
jgi:hypothetical protein